MESISSPSDEMQYVNMNGVRVIKVDLNHPEIRARAIQANDSGGKEKVQSMAMVLTYPANDQSLAPVVVGQDIRPSAQRQSGCPDCVHFNACASGTDNNATVAIPGTVPVVHSDGAFTPEAGDEFAVFRPDDNLCTGAIRWAGAGGSQALTVWGDDSITSELVDGMVSGEVMRWVVWDASTNTGYGANVEYDSTPPLHPNGGYGANRFYALTVLEPTGEPLSGAEAFIPLVIVQ